MTEFQWKFASRAAVVTAVIAVIFASAGAHADPLFRQMVGTWDGTGSRNYPISGQQVQVRETVVTTLETIDGQPAVVSKNQITEISPAAAPYSYTVSYWVKAQDDQPGTYELGSEGAAGSGPVSATGILGSDGVFRVVQDLGNGYVVHSETTFAPGKSVYSEVFTSGTTVQSRTKVDFTRVTQRVSHQ